VAGPLVNGPTKATHRLEASLNRIAGRRKM
jgi:hypothetical protein